MYIYLGCTQPRVEVDHRQINEKVELFGRIVNPNVTDENSSIESTADPQVLQSSTSEEHVFSERNKLTTDRITAWSFDMQGHAGNFN